MIGMKDTERYVIIGIITTLAARAYDGEIDLAEALTNILSKAGEVGRGKYSYQHY